LVSLSRYRSEDTVPKWDETRLIGAGLEDLGREGRRGGDERWSLRPRPALGHSRIVRGIRPSEIILVIVLSDGLLRRRRSGSCDGFPEDGEGRLVPRIDF
jgi:hypothetical protein